MNKKIQDIVNEQAEDEGLWFQAKYTTEAYLQQELRRLHVAIENDSELDKSMEEN